LKGLLPKMAVIVVDLVKTGTDTVLAQNAIVAITLPWAIRVVDMWTIAGASEASCTVQLRSGTNAIHTAIACDTDGNLIRISAGLDQDYMTIAKGGSLQVLVAGAAAPADSVACILVEIRP